MLSKDNDRAIALATLRALPIHSVPPLLTALGHKDVSVRVFACDALGKLGPSAKEAMPALEERAKSDDGKVKDAAKKALALIGKPADAAAKTQ